MKRFAADLLFAIRQLRKTPGVSLLAVMTLALGIGANAAIFTVIESVLLRPLPYAHSDRLVFIGPAQDKATFGSTSWLNYHDVRAQSKSFSDVSGYTEDVSVIESPDGSRSVTAPRVSPNAFSLLGVRPLLGRTFTEAEGESNGPAVVLLSENMWRQDFHSDPGIVGHTVRIGGEAHTIVGVMPKGFSFPESMGPDMQKGIWLPLQPTDEMLKSRGDNFFNVIGQLRPGVSVAQAQQELNAIAARIGNNVAFRASLYQEVVTGSVRPVLFTMFAALGLVLLIACVNVSNLLIARCLSRRQEFAVRAALGANKGRLVAQMLTEGMLLSVLGCSVGALLAKAAIEGVRKLPEGTIPRGDAIAMHWPVVIVLAGIAVLVTVLSSLLPALLVSRSNPQAALQNASRGLGTRGVSGQFSQFLVAVEVTLSTLLLVGAGLLAHTLWNLEKSDLGFSAEHVSTFTVMPGDAAGFSRMAVSSDTSKAAPSVATLVYQPMLERVRHAPGVESAALATSAPLSGVNIGTSFTIEGQPTAPHHEPEGQITAVSGDYARTMGTPMVRGRMIEDSDADTSPFVAVINEALAKKYFAGKDPLNKQIEIGGKDTGMLKPYTVVGVIADQIDRNVGSAPRPLILISDQQVPTTSLFYQALLKTVVSFVVKTRGNIAVMGEVRPIFKKFAPEFALDNFSTMQQVVDSNTFGHRLGLYLVGSFAGLAIAMVIAGLYGMLSQLVGYRRREIGVRMSLGATRSGIAGMILRQGSILIGAGLLCGLVLAAVTGRVLKSYLYEVQPLDGWSYLFAALALLAVGLIASLIPARKAASIEPMEALRTE